MYRNNSIIGVIIGLFFMVIFGLGFILFMPFQGFYFIPIIPIVFIIIIIIVIISVVMASRNAYTYRYNNGTMRSINLGQRNPYLIQNPPFTFRERDQSTSPVNSAKIITTKHYCQYCGIRIEDDAVFCHGCGTKLVD